MVKLEQGKHYKWTYNTTVSYYKVKKLFTDHTHPGPPTNEVIIDLYGVIMVLEKTSGI